MAIDWTILTPSEFEELCYTLADANGFQELRWYGKGGGDKGRDILAKKEIAYTDRTRESESWIIQCKRYTTQPPGVAQISALFEQCREHRPDHVLIIISNTLSADTKDWIDSVRPEYRFRIHLWEEMDLVREIRAHKGHLLPQFAAFLTRINILPDDEPMSFGRIQMSPAYYVCDKFDVGFFILNDEGHERNVEWITKFIEYLRNHDVEFESEDAQSDGEH